MHLSFVVPSHPVVLGCRSGVTPPNHVSDARWPARWSPRILVVWPGLDEGVRVLRGGQSSVTARTMLTPAQSGGLSEQQRHYSATGPFAPRGCAPRPRPRRASRRRRRRERSAGSSRAPASTRGPPPAASRLAASCSAVISRAWLPLTGRGRWAS